MSTATPGSRTTARTWWASPVLSTSLPLCVRYTASWRESSAGLSAVTGTVASGADEAGPFSLPTPSTKIERLTYCSANSTKEHLVTRPERWPGAHAAKALCGSMTDRGLWINRTKLDALKRRAGSDEKRCLQDCTEHVTLRLSKLPCWSHLTDFEYQTQMKAICRDISDEAAHDRRQNGLSVLGVKRLLRYSPQHVPKRMDKTPAPKVHSCCPEFRAQFKAAYRDFVDGYREALQALNRGLLTPLFPQGRLATWVQLRSRLGLDFIPIQNT